MLEARREFEAVDCSEDNVVATITAKGATINIIDLSPDPLLDDGCPADTDLAVRVKHPISVSEALIMCARNLESPHPGDPGEGGGKFMVGDCLTIGGGLSPGGNAGVTELPCDPPGWFAVVVALAPTPEACPPEALSRIPSPGRPGEVLCLAPNGPTASGGTMLSPGQCMAEHPYGAWALLTPVLDDCTGVLAWRFVAFADDAGGCPSEDLAAYRVTGYDRQLCGSNP
jgi:hypothetical protein